jgi:transcriptional regulator with XRE-family HTH domain
VADDFQTRFRDALRRRLYPQAGLHLKQVAAAIGRAENTVARWWRGETRILAEDVYSLAAFFASRGDRDFLPEIFVEFLPAASASLSDDMASSVLALIRSALTNPDRGVAGNREACIWFTADGALAAAPQGHAAYARSALRLPGVGGDVAAYAMRVLGWIAVTERGDSGVSIRHDGRRVAPLAAERICDWLEDRADRLEQLRRSIVMDGRAVEAHHVSAHAAAAAIAKVAFIVRVPRRPWTVRPLPLDRISDPRLGALLEVYREQPRQLVRMAAAMGAFTTSSLFGVTGSDVVSHCVGTDLGFDPETVEGLNVLSRPDTEYALMLRARILATRRDGPVYNELCGTIDAYNVRYLNLALPEAGSSGRVLTSSVVLERELIAA